ncbi:hypothetical protein HGH93_00460 [Chitinophaga polysaccharea]|uniref:hypothetical protein n=1 Tax=Chitinophaga TaxID=79328 RepID=UPI001454FED9|nr:MULTISPECIES: hypothetical protein [Chitinophaga]NLR56550.1 hypothetical protein [Chitinophaga polysaccharea]NLU92780.1 hypothetical protein [Chitinophaga sp. Ak27]
MDFATFALVYKRYLHKILAILLLGVFTLNTIPREFIHEFAGHHDTVDAVHQHDGLTISEQHRHCDFLQIGVEPYEPFVTYYIAPVWQVNWIFFPLPIPETTHATYYNLTPRAPPAVAML